MQLYTCGAGGAYGDSGVSRRRAGRRVAGGDRGCPSARAAREGGRAAGAAHPGAIWAVAERPLLAVHLNRPMENAPQAERVPREPIQRLYGLISMAVRRVRDVINLASALGVHPRGFSGSGPPQRGRAACRRAQPASQVGSRTLIDTSAMPAARPSAAPMGSTTSRPARLRKLLPCACGLQSGLSSLLGVEKSAFPWARRGALL